MTTTLEGSRTSRRSAPAVRRSLSLVEQFERLSGGYPFFGTIVGTRQYIVPGFVQQVALWVAQQFPTVPLRTEEFFQRVLSRCQADHPEWFAEATALWMERPSRELQAGVNVFRITRNFAQIPDSTVPASVVEAYTNAITEDRRRVRRFWYFEPIFNASTGTLVPTTINEFNTMLHGQQEAIARMVPRIRRALFVNSVIDPSLERITDCICIAAALPFIATWKTLRQTARVLHIISESIGITRPLSVFDIRQWAEARERYELYTTGHRASGMRQEMTFQEALSTLSRSPFARFSTAELDRIVRLYDPIIAFSLKTLRGTQLRKEFGGQPLALVSHW